MKELVGEEAGPDGFSRAAEKMTTFFYADDGLLDSMREKRLHQAFNTLTDLFKRMGLRMNFGKTASMACQPFQ